MKIKIASDSSFSKDERLKIDQNKDYEVEEAFKVLASLNAVIYSYNEDTKTVTINHVFYW